MERKNGVVVNSDCPDVVMVKHLQGEEGFYSKPTANSRFTSLKWHLKSAYWQVLKPEERSLLESWVAYA